MKQIRKKKRKARTHTTTMDPTMREDLLFLLAKLGIFLLLLVLLFGVIFGIYRSSDSMMAPALKDGDLAFYYRLQKEFHQDDLVVLKKEGEVQVRRIVALPGDTVEITAEGLKINGYFQQEKNIYKETLPYTEGITFPVTLGEDEYFVLGDDRTGAKDSRMYGTVSKQEIKGSVITLIRHRGF